MQTPVLYKYQNGNVAVTIHESGTKIREWPDDEQPTVEYPESCDLKITQYCNMGSDGSQKCNFCLTPGHNILTLDGNKLVEDIQVGDIVLSFNEGSACYEFKRVDKLYQRDVEDEIFEIETDDGSILKITANHKVYTTRGYIRADELSTDDKILSFSLNAMDG